MTMKVIVTSENNVKVEAVSLALSAMFPNKAFELTPVSVSSGVSDQPQGDDETLQGAMTRVQSAIKLYPNHDLFFANESGIKEIKGDLYMMNWVVVSDGKKFSSTQAASFPIPKDVAKLVKKGHECGEAFVAVFGDKAKKQGIGGIGNLTGGALPRAQLVAQAFVTALIPFKNSDLY